MGGGWLKSEGNVCHVVPMGRNCVAAIRRAAPGAKLVLLVTETVPTVPDAAHAIVPIEAPFLEIV